MPSRKIALLVAEVQQMALDPLVVTRCKTEHYVANLHKATPFPAMLDLVERYHGRIPMGIGTGSPASMPKRCCAIPGSIAISPWWSPPTTWSCTNPIQTPSCWWRDAWV
jgi:hypothetical protein